MATFHAHLLKKIDAELSVHGISFTEFLVLHYLNEAPKLTMRRIDLAEKIGLSASGVTRLLNPMEKIGLVQRKSNPRDARVSLVELSDAGAALFNNAEKTFSDIAKTILNPLKEKQLQLLFNIINQLQ
jgi:DNA-binding MarR family transcriptional regulator